MTVAELKALCKERNIHVQSKMKKDELIAKLSRPKTPILEETDDVVRCAEVAVQPVNYSKMTVAELKSLCKERNIKVDSKAKKTDIVSLLEKTQTINADDSKSESDVNTDVVPDYSKMTVSELKNKCKQQNLKHDSKAKKADLVALLESAKLIPATSQSSTMINGSKNDEKVEYVDVEVVFYNNGKRLKFNDMSGKEIESIQDAIKHIIYIDVEKIDQTFVYRGEDQEYLILKNVEKKNGQIGKYKKYNNNEKNDVEVEQYGVNAWGKTQMKFIEIQNYVKMAVGELRGICIRMGINHYSKSKSELVSLLENASMNNDNDEEVVEDGDDDYVEKQTVLFEYDGEKYWMDTEENANGIHDIYSYDSLEHIGFYDKSNNMILHIDE